MRHATRRDATADTGAAPAPSGPVRAGASAQSCRVQLSRTCTQPGEYTLTFDFNASGRRILARLDVADRAYDKRHPHGHRPPPIAFGVGLRYTPSD